jgi:pilus assembly protein Flp/PilA
MIPVDIITINVGPKISWHVGIVRNITSSVPGMGSIRPAGFVTTYGPIGVSDMYEYLMSLAQLKADRRAVTALEYGLIAGLIALVIIGAVTSIGTGLFAKFDAISTGL